MERIVLIGSGRVATHLGARLRQCGLNIVQVYSRSLPRATALAYRLEASATDRLTDIVPTADLYLLAIHDDAIGAVAATLRTVLPPTARLAHTSGATPVAVLTEHFAQGGVFYPLQTFTTGRPLDFSTIPLCCFSPNPELEQELLTLAHRISPSVHRIDDTQRATLHVAAVFVNNFTNYLYRIGHDILTTEGLPFDLLRPLILETAAKVQNRDPADAQTGPAARGDQSTQERHLQQLQDQPAWAEIYRLLSAGIRE